MLEASVRDEILSILLEPEIGAKLKRAALLCAAKEKIAARADSGEALPDLIPARPPSFEVRTADAMPRRRRIGDQLGRYALAHSVGHIELSAIELALAAVGDFPDEEPAYYRAMLHIAEEEIRHTEMMMQRLSELGGALGTEPVHLGLWETAREFSDVLDRLAVVPRILEARGLDVSPGLQAELLRYGDEGTAACLRVIHRDEIGHVAIGTHWYRRIAKGRGHNPEAYWLKLAERFRPGRPSPLDREGRLKAGFTERELEACVAKPRA